MHFPVILSCFALCLSIGFVKTDDPIRIVSVDDKDPQVLNIDVLTIDGDQAADPPSKRVLDFEIDIIQGQDSPAAVQDEEGKGKDQYDDILIDSGLKDPQDEPALDLAPAKEGDDKMVKKPKKPSKKDDCPEQEDCDDDTDTDGQDCDDDTDAEDCNDDTDAKECDDDKDPEKCDDDTDAEECDDDKDPEDCDKSGKNADIIDVE